MRILLALGLVVLSAGVPSLSGAVDYPTPLAPDAGGQLAKLPAQYPADWAFLNFPYARIEIRDIGSDRHETRGELAARDSTVFLLATQRPEIYTLDTVWSRGVRGDRTDFITIYDTSTLNVTGEIVLPTKRALVSPMSGTFVFTDHERLGLVFNFTPASSVTVVDLVKRKVLGQVDIPGCSLLYPTGERGFSTLCGSGNLLSVRLGADGKALGHSETSKFNDLDKDPLFTEAASIGAVSYFPSMLGHVQPIDLGGEEPKLLPAWSLVTAEDVAGNWRPSGWQTIASDEHGQLYVLMQPNAHEGSHKDPAAEVWVFDVQTQKRVRRMRLVRPASTLAMSHGAQPLMLAQTDNGLDVYDPATGALLRRLGIEGLSNHMLVKTVR